MKRILLPLVLFTSLATAAPAEAPEPTAGQTLPSFAGFQLDGSVVSLKKLLASAVPQPRVLVVSTYGTWCGPCQEGLPKVHQVVSSMKDRNVAGVVIAVNDDAQKLAPAMQKLHITNMTVVPDPYGEISRRLGLDKKLPRTLVLNGKGVVQHIFADEKAKDFEDRLRKAIEDAAAN